MVMSGMHILFVHSTAMTNDGVCVDEANAEDTVDIAEASVPLTSPAGEETVQQIAETMIGLFFLDHIIVIAIRRRERFAPGHGFDLATRRLTGDCANIIKILSQFCNLFRYNIATNYMWCRVRFALS